MSPRSEPIRTRSSSSRANFIFSCSGYYRYDKGYVPEFPGLDAFEGTVVHPQEWPEDLDYAAKRVVVIGSGATAITLIPSLAKDAAHVTMLQRSPTYIVSMPAKDPLANLLRRTLPSRVSGPVIRWFKALTTQASYFLSKRRPELVKSVLKRQVIRQLPAGYDVGTHFTPTYNPWDQRLCLVPNGDLFKAIREGSASVVTDHIKTFTKHGIVLDSGDAPRRRHRRHRHGARVALHRRHPPDGRRRGRRRAEPAHLQGDDARGVPNFAMSIGYTNASWTLKCDLTCDYVTKLLNHMHDTGLRQCTATNQDETITKAPLMGLSSGYIDRAPETACPSRARHFRGRSARATWPTTGP